MLVSCAPANNKSSEILINNEIVSEKITDHNNKQEYEPKIIEKIEIVRNTNLNKGEKLNNKITIILSKKDNPKTVSQFINVVELAVYKKKLKNISFEIKIYDDPNELTTFLDSLKLSGKIFIGPLNTNDSKLLDKYCDEGATFFSFSSNRGLAKNCVYLVNFFPENEMKTIFNFFPPDSKVALLYPENEYGFSINEMIDAIANKSKSVIVNRASYNENLTNAPLAIKELGKYELRKYELNRQKKILASRNDKESKKRLIKLERFQTTKDFDFTHVIIADYGLRLLQVAPLLPYYDIDPNVVKFVGTGAWDDKIFYDEPSLNGSIYPGIEFTKRKQLAEDYYELYEENLIRTSTLPFDLVGLLYFVINNNYNTLSLKKLLNQNNIKFEGIDGSFYFINNVIERDLSVLKINNGKIEVISE